ncbi:carbohydrate kinase family protein [Sediminispirochaeta smaragdinae]|uniref:PfkB domain protein n=1 Tax=Sediminispirochaeta smaragdinae (strain DSM 11293 / JCM 15392 / SEBR 4228) TaxID=573413 RepID=E1R488_SEDSS|nr:carbohydrate kinase family protein [Sediminispirochaeta smaragdinae]ADK80510.1 PfkB domain protein [Sediminispirochaeta smaragdinae DSM 11293]
MSKFEMICAGITCLDIVVTGNIGPHVFQVDSTPVDTISLGIGGDAANQAITASSLGLSAALFSCVGDDWKAENLSGLLSEKGICIEYLQRYEHDTTMSSLVLVGREGQRNFLFDRGCGKNYVPNAYSLEAVKKARLLSIGSLFVMPEFDRHGAGSLLAEAKRHGVITVADMTCDTEGAADEVLDVLLPHIDYLMPSLEEASAVTGAGDPAEMCRKLRDRGAGNVVIKLGSQGCYIDIDGVRGQIPAFTDIEVLDTTGCGDTFVAAFSYGILKGYPPEECAAFAQAAAAINATHIGACGHIPSVEAVRSFLRDHPTQKIVS